MPFRNHPLRPWPVAPVDAGRCHQPRALHGPGESAIMGKPAGRSVGSHEFGHYWMARHHGVPVTLPYFIPAPTLIGTFGAFIRIQAVVPNRGALFNIGVAGPIAGFVVAVPAIVMGL